MKPTFPTVDCIVCGQTHRPTQLMCGDCAQLVDRDLRINESISRRNIILAIRKAEPMLLRDAFIRDPAYVEIGKRAYMQARSRLEASFSTGHVNDRLRRENALVHLD